MIGKIGITGGIASGKSLVAGALAEMLHCAKIDADEICSRLLQPQAEGWQKFYSVFGSKYFADDYFIDRPRLRRDLFADEDLRCKVNDIIHPLVKRSIRDQMDNIISSGPGSRVLVEVPLLYEVHWENLFDTIVVVYADYDSCLRRLMERDGVERFTAIKEMESQLPLSEKAMKADHVIDNSGMLPETISQVEHLAALLDSTGGHQFTGPLQNL